MCYLVEPVAAIGSISTSDSLSTENSSVERDAFSNLQAFRRSVLRQYFETLNAGRFQETAALFAPNGALVPPFEDPVLGNLAIAQYLQAEAQGMNLSPQASVEEMLQNGDCRIQIRGRVQTPLFGVNVAWDFVLNSGNEILLVSVNLLASLEELLPWRRG